MLLKYLQCRQDEQRVRVTEGNIVRKYYPGTLTDTCSSATAFAINSIWSGTGTNQAYVMRRPATNHLGHWHHIPECINLHSHPSENFDCHQAIDLYSRAIPCLHGAEFRQKARLIRSLFGVSSVLSCYVQK